MRFKRKSLWIVSENIRYFTSKEKHFYEAKHLNKFYKYKKENSWIAR